MKGHEPRQWEAMLEKERAVDAGCAGGTRPPCVMRPLGVATVSDEATVQPPGESPGVAVGHLPGGDQRERAVVGSTRAAQGKWRIQVYLEESSWPCRWAGGGCGRQGSRMTHRSVS